MDFCRYVSSNFQKNALLFSSRQCTLRSLENGTAQQQNVPFLQPQSRPAPDVFTRRGHSSRRACSHTHTGALDESSAFLPSFSDCFGYLGFTTDFNKFLNSDAYQRSSTKSMEIQSNFENNVAITSNILIHYLKCIFSLT